MTGNLKISDDDVSKLDIENYETSYLLKEIFNNFDLHQIPYCVERNYQNYPDVITGDVDIIIGDFDIKKASKLILEIANKNKWFAYQIYSWDKTVFLGLCSNCYPRRFTLTVELFSGACWHGIEFLSGREVTKHRIKHGITWKPRPGHQALITSVHHLLYGNGIPVKYREEIYRLTSIDHEEMSLKLKSLVGKKYANFFIKNILNQNWEFFNNNFVSRIRLFFIIKSFLRNPIINFVIIYKGFIAQWKKPDGVSIFFNLSDCENNDTLMKITRNICIKWHIFKPPHRNIIDNIDANKKAQNIFSYSINSGGMALVNKKRAYNLHYNSKYPSYSIDQINNSLVLSKQKDVKYDLCNFELEDDLKKMSLKIISLILLDRAEIFSSIGSLKKP